ncbi:MAG: hypothetical protein MUC59_01145 [Saprospiraceae bacterium]|nr:hypothetical protein [Saprospiraceae bacterium]
MKGNYNLYLGKAGHLAVMSEFLTRGWNVAIPEVDIGDDIFVVQDENGTLQRVQVKTSASKTTKNGFRAQFSLPIRQLRNISNILVHYVFIVRHNGAWSTPVIIRQDYLLDFFENEQIGSRHNDHLNLHFSFEPAGVRCSKLDLTSFLADYSDFPIVE